MYVVRRNGEKHEFDDFARAWKECNLAAVINYEENEFIGDFYKNTKKRLDKGNWLRYGNPATEIYKI
jgi:hypothetical protein